MATYDQCVLELSAAAECVAIDAGATCAECFNPTSFQEEFPQAVRTHLYSALAFVSELDPQFCSVANDRVCEAYIVDQSCCCPTETEVYRKCLFNDIMLNQFSIASCTDSCGESKSGSGAKGGGIGLVVIIAVSVVAILLGCCIGFFFYRRKRSISIQKAESPAGSKATNMDNISAASELDFGGDMGAHPQIGSTIVYESDLEGGSALSPSSKSEKKLRKSSSTVDLEVKAEPKENRAVRKSHSSPDLTDRDQRLSSSPKTNRDRSKSAKDRKAKAETEFQAKLHSSFSTLDIAGISSPGRNDGNGDGKERRRRQKSDSLRKSHSVSDLRREESDEGSPESSTEKKRRAKKLAEKRLTDAVGAAKVSLSRNSSDRSLGANDEKEESDERRRPRKSNSLKKSQSDPYLRKESSQNDLKSNEHDGTDSPSKTEKRRAKKEGGKKVLRSSSDRSLKLDSEEGNDKKSRRRKESSLRKSQSDPYLNKASDMNEEREAKKDGEKKVSRSSSDRSLRLDSEEGNDKKSRRRKDSSLRKSQSDPYLNKASDMDEERETKRRTKKDDDKMSKSPRDIGRSSSDRSLKKRLD
jgi:hypothetical protein